MSKFIVQQYFKQKPEQVFAAFSKHRIYNAAFWPVQVVRIKDSADPQNPDGVGSIRAMGFGPIKPVHEQIIVMQPDELIEYKLINNPLVSHHLGRLQFAAKGDGTLLTYTIEFVGKLPLSSLLVSSNLKVVVKLGLAKIARKL